MKFLTLFFFSRVIFYRWYKRDMLTCVVCLDNSKRWIYMVKQYKEKKRDDDNDGNTVLVCCVSSSAVEYIMHVCVWRRWKWKVVLILNVCICLLVYSSAKKTRATTTTRASSADSDNCRMRLWYYGGYMTLIYRRKKCWKMGQFWGWVVAWAWNACFLPIENLNIFDFNVRSRVCTLHAWKWVETFEILYDKHAFLEKGDRVKVVIFTVRYFLFSILLLSIVAIAVVVFFCVTKRKQCGNYKLEKN